MCYNPFLSLFFLDAQIFPDVARGSPFILFASVFEHVLAF